MPLYYYTDETENSAIKSNQEISATDTSDGLGKVVRFTELPPNTPKAALIADIWGTGNEPSDAEDKIECWFQFKKSKLPSGTTRSANVGTRNVWTCPVDVPITSSRCSLLYNSTVPLHKPRRKGWHPPRQGHQRDRCGGWPGNSVVRFTELVYNTPQPELIANNWGRSDISSEDKEKLRFWFKFELRDLPVGTRQVKLGARNIWICPVEVPLKPIRRPKTRPAKSGDGKTILYHYTDRNGKDAIYASGYIKAMRPHGGQGLGATMPVAVYFTELAPDSKKEDLLWNMYATRDLTKTDMVEKTRYWFKFESTDLPDVQPRPNRNNRNEWVCPHDVPIKSSTNRGVMTTDGNGPQPQAQSRPKRSPSPKKSICRIQ